MNRKTEKLTPDNTPSMPDRRKLLLAGAGIATATLMAHAGAAENVSQNLNSHRNSHRHQRQKLLTEKRWLGRLEVSSLGLGVQNMSRKYDTSTPWRPEMVNIIRNAYERGITFFDSAEAYGPFEVERILGEAVAPFRDKVVIATKFGWNIDQETGARLPGLNSRPEHIKRVVEGMLQRLRTDRIDLLYQHRVDPQIPIEDVVGAVKDLMDQGKVLHWGMSEMGIHTLKRAHALLPVTAVQSEYSMLWRGPEKAVLPVCEELGIGFVPWSPLGVQFLTGWISKDTRFAQGDIRAVESRFAPENLAQNMPLVELLKTWAQRKNAAPAQIALAWLLARKPWIVPIPGTTNNDHMVQNSQAASIHLRAEEMDELTSALGNITIKGQRLPDAVLAYSDVEAPLKKG